MSDHQDGYPPIDSGEPGAAPLWEREIPVRVSGEVNTLDWHRFIDWLPRIGASLWIHRDVPDRVFPRARMLAQGVLLLDHPALAALSDCVEVTALASVTAMGPREWLELRDTNDRLIARLYLLPDSDYHAWDAMLADCGIQQVMTVAAQTRNVLARFMRGIGEHGPWQAQVTRFPLLRLPCLQVLGLRAPAALSALGQQVAIKIARDECAAFVPAS